MLSINVYHLCHSHFWCLISAPSTNLLLLPYQGKLGGGEGVVGIYGSITQAGMSKIFACMMKDTGFGPNSVLLDVGAGLGR
jgi:hypothetical protein